MLPFSYLPNKVEGSRIHVEDSTDLGDQGVKHVMDILCSKHPNTTPAKPGALMMGNANPPPVHPVVYDQITASWIRSVALRVKVAAGPLVWMYTGEKTLHPSCQEVMYHSCRPKRHLIFAGLPLNWLNKCPGVRHIGIAEYHRRIVAKAVLLITRSYLQDATGPRQPCPGQFASIEMAAHGMRAMFSRKDTDAVLLVDSTNAFTSLNRKMALCNI